MRKSEGETQKSNLAEIEWILGVRFFNGSCSEAVDFMCRSGGLLVVPAAPALVNIQYDRRYRESLVQSDLAIADSGAMVLLWRFLRGRVIKRISGLAYTRRLLEVPSLKEAGKTFFVIPSEEAQTRTLAWLNQHKFAACKRDCYVAPDYAANPSQKNTGVVDDRLIALIRERKPEHVVIALGGGTQEKLGLYVKDSCGYCPAIHCVGAALGFVTGDQKAIPWWVDKLYLGWLLETRAESKTLRASLLGRARIARDDQEIWGCYSSSQELINTFVLAKCPIPSETRSAASRTDYRPLHRSHERRHFSDGRRIYRSEGFRS